jgi:hypothetical protein
MAYLRYSDDCPWYVYVTTSREGQEVLEVDGVGEIRAEELAARMPAILANIEAHCAKQWDRPPNEGEMDMLREVFEVYLDRVRQEAAEAMADERAGK